MKEYSCFDILGPVMVGPSSSHTAGACRLGGIARLVAGGNVKSVKFLLHGSFARTYKGHGTDRALLAGVLGMRPDDERLPEAFTLAKEAGVEYSYEPTDLGDVHPNTVRIEITSSTGHVTTLVGSSTGGGAVLVTQVDDMPVEFTGDYNTLITMHLDRPGVVSRVTNGLAAYDVNIAFMRVYRRERGALSCMVIESDQPIPNELAAYLVRMPGIERAIILPTVGGMVS